MKDHSHKRTTDAASRDMDFPFGIICMTGGGRRCILWFTTRIETKDTMVKLRV